MKVFHDKNVQNCDSLMQEIKFTYFKNVNVLFQTGCFVTIQKVAVFNTCGCEIRPHNTFTETNTQTNTPKLNKDTGFYSRSHLAFLFSSSFQLQPQRVTP